MLNDSLSNSGQQIYGAVGGSDSESLAVRIELPLDRGDLQVVGICSGADGVVKITIDGQDTFKLNCSVDEEIQPLSPALDVVGNQLLVEAAGVPPSAMWAVAVTDAPERASTSPQLRMR